MTDSFKAKVDNYLTAISLLVISIYLISVFSDANAADFNKAIPTVLKHEGHLTYDAKDPGGVTNYGLSFRYLQDLIKKEPDVMNAIDANGNHILDAFDVSHITLEEAIKIYRKDWWDKYRFGTIDYQPLANKMFDLSVNMGEAETIKLLARAYLKLYPHETSGTMYEFVNKLPADTQQKLVRLLCLEAENFYRDIAKTHPAYNKFLKGWLNRVWDGVKR